MQTDLRLRVAEYQHRRSQSGRLWRPYNHGYGLYSCVNLIQEMLTERKRVGDAAMAPHETTEIITKVQDRTALNSTATTWAYGDRKLVFSIISKDESAEQM